MKNFFKKTAFSLLFFLFFSFSLTPGKAQVRPTGKLTNYNAVLTSGENEYLLGRNRLTLDLSAPLSRGKVFISNEILNTYTDSLNNFHYELNEAYFDLYLKSIDLRIGKQIVTYGRADGVFITDIVSPLDLSEFLTQPVDLIKTGITSVKATRYFGSNYLEVLATPVFQSHVLAKPESRWYPFGQVEQDFSVSYPDSSFEETRKLFQASVRYAFRDNINWNLDLFGMYWTEGNPGFKKELAFTGTPPGPSLRLTPAYLQRIILAYSGNYILNDNLILKSESAFHFRKHFDYLPQLIIENDIEDLEPEELNRLNQEFAANEDGYLKIKPWLISMIGFQYDLSGWRLMGQFINEHVFNHEEIILQKQNFMYSTLQIQHSFLRDKLQALFFGRYNITGQDFWLNPEATYELADEIEASLGFHLFGGNSTDRLYGHFSFRDYKQSSLGYLKLTAYF